MAKFIQLTEENTGNALFINIDELCYFVQYENYCSLNFKGTARHATETPEQILALIEAANAK